MLERLLVVAALALIGLAAYLLFARLHVRKAAAAAARDALLREFRPGVPAVVYFTTDVCAPCKTMQWPAIQRLERELGDGVQVFRVDACAEAEAAERWGVFSVPTTFILDGAGRPREVNHGVTDTEKLKRQLLSLTA